MLIMMEITRLQYKLTEDFDSVNHPQTVYAITKSRPINTLAMGGKCVKGNVMENGL